MKAISITDVRTIHTAPAGIDLVVVKVETSEPGLFGLGCATFTQRHWAVKPAVETYLKPLIVGRDPANIEDIWNTAMVSSYWRNGPVLNNALSGVDMALWDIKAKRAAMPLYELFGGKTREAVSLYRHADGRTLEELTEKVQAFREEGYHYIRCQFGGYGGRYGERGVLGRTPDGSHEGAYYDPAEYARSVPRMFEHVRRAVGFEVELLHDIHERLPPVDAVRLAKDLEQFRLFFLEDPLAPEQIDWFRELRAQTSIPLAMGELFVNPVEWMPLVREKLIDYVRCHISAIGGITPARKLAVLCEAFDIRTAWHGPGDVSPVGHAANLHLDISSSNFGVQEWSGINDALREVFPGCPEVVNGYAVLSDRPGLGIDLDEKKAARYPCPEYRSADWTQARRPDGSWARP